MNKEYVSSKIISNETGKEMIAVTNEEGKLELREPLNKSPEIFEIENLKEKIEKLLKEHEGKQDEMEEKDKKNRSLEEIISKFFRLIPGLFVCGLITYALLCGDGQSIIAGFEGYFLTFTYLSFGSLMIKDIVIDVKENISFRRKKIANESTIKLLNHLLDKTNTRLEKLKQESMLEDETCYNLTEVSTTSLKNLDTKLKLIEGCATYSNAALRIIDEPSSNPSAIFSYCYGKCQTDTIYTFIKNDSNETTIDEQEKTIVSDCLRKCQNIGLRKVLRKNERR